MLVFMYLLFYVTWLELSQILPYRQIESQAICSCLYESQLYVLRNCL